MPGRWPHLWFLGLVSCHGSNVLDLPTVDPTPRAALVALETPDQAPKVLAIDLTQTSFPSLELFEATRMTILYYERDLDDFALKPGPVEVIDLGQAEGTSARPLPTPDKIYESPPGRGVRGFAMLLALSESLSRLRLPGVDQATCLASGGCFERSPTSNNSVCRTPCRPRLPTPPTPPEPPVVDDTCGPGLVERTFREGLVKACEPPIRVSSCAPGSVQGRGDDDCRPIADASCPVGLFAVPPTTGRAVYVDPAVAPGGAGTVASPYATLAEMARDLRSGDVVMLAKGTHRGAIDLPSVRDGRFSIVGACVEETILVSPDNQAPLRLRGTVDVRDVTLTGPGRGLRATDAAQVTVRRILVEAPLGIWVTNGARIGGTDVRARDLRPAVTAESRLIEVSGSTVALGAVTLELGADGYRNGASEGRVGLFADAGSFATLDDFVIVGGWRSVNVLGSRARLTNGLVELAKKEGIRSVNANGRLEIEGVVIRDVGVYGLSGDAAGVTLGVGARGDLRRMYFRNTFNRAIYLTTATASVSDVVVEASPGLLLERNGTFPSRSIVERLHLEQPGRYGISVEDGSHLVVRDLWLSGARLEGSAEGDGLRNFDSDVTLERCHFEDGLARAIIAYPEGTTTVTDCRITGFLVGIGLFAIGGSLELNRAAIDQSRAVGLCLAPDGYADIQNLEVTRTGAETGMCPALESAGGTGILVSANTEARLFDFLVENNDNIGISLFGAEGFNAGDGTIRANGIGLRAPRDLVVDQKLLGVRFEANQANLDLQ